jgi:hypothetical protein
VQRQQSEARDIGEHIYDGAEGDAKTELLMLRERTRSAR